MSKIEITGRGMARPYTHGTACQCDDCTAKREEPTRTIRPALTVTLEGDTLVFASPAAEHLAAERIRDAAPALLAACGYVEFAAEGIDCDDEDDLVTITLKMGGLTDIRAAIAAARGE